MTAAAIISAFGFGFIAGALWAARLTDEDE